MVKLLHACLPFDHVSANKADRLKAMLEEEVCGASVDSYYNIFIIVKSV